MDVLDTGDELVSKQQYGLEREFAVAEVEQVLQTGAQKVDDHGIVVAFRTEPSHEGDADAAGEGLVDTGLVFQLGVLGLNALELDGNLLAGDNIGALIVVSLRS